MSSLQGQKVKDTYRDLLQVSNSNTGIDSNLRTVSDGEGTNSPLKLSSVNISLNGSIWPTDYGTANQVLKTDGAGTLSWGTGGGGGGSIATLTDVTLSGLASNNLLQYNGSAWVNRTLAAAGISAVGHTHVSADITDLATSTVTFSNKSGNISQWTNNAGYLTSVPTQTIITVANEATDTTCFPAFFTAATGDLGPKTNAGLTFNSNTGVLAATGFSGPLTGNVSGNASTVTTNANLTGPITSVGNTTSIASQTGTGSKFVVDTSPTLVTPVLGVATATSINKVALTAPATGSTLTIADAQTLTVNGSATITNGTHSGTNTGDQLVFKTISVSGQSDVVADTTADTLTLVAGTNVTITTNATTDSITINAAGGGGGLSDADYGDVTVSGAGTVMTVDSVTVADAAADTTTWPMLSRNVTGANQVVSTDPGLTYDASANSLATTTFVGALTGNASTATALATPRAIGGVNFDGTAAITPANITISNEGTDTTCFPLFTTAATGDLPPKSNAALTYNSNTGNLGSTTFTGALVGNVTGNVSGSSGSTTGNAATVTTNANLTGPITSTGNATAVASQTGTGSKFVMDTSPTLVTPVLGVATATSLNKVTVTQPATGSTLTIQDGFTLTATGNASISGTHTGTSSGTNTGDQTLPNVFGTISVSGQSDVVADSTSDTLTLVAGSNVTITTNAGTDTITIAATGGGGTTPTGLIYCVSHNLFLS